jgi:hypothetical protein
MVDVLITGETRRVEDALAEFKSLLGDRLAKPRRRRAGS